MSSGTEFTIPSMYDGTALQCRLELPAAATATTAATAAAAPAWRPRVAVVAHPYAPLGGSFDDPVVRTVARELLRMGYAVATFNFRWAATC
ncbi:hypothetical protein KEM52_001158 [Ascosphaera acerosa]|nr:hypothetical protein KEM52_001158 [Ascosphaera acerosa]